jgi:propionyl-CoA carboxylase alpha chain
MSPYTAGMSFDEFEAGKDVHVETISDFQWIDGNPLAQMRLKGRTGGDKDSVITRFLQYEGRGAESYKLRYLGSQQEVIVRTVREQELSEYMLPPVVKDTSRYLLCPMPGTLISLSVSPGQKVESGQQLAVVEAMKMQVDLHI